jgi:RNA polymerase sigma-70 factor (ECF subfamily)
MAQEPTTAAVQRYLDALAGDPPADTLIRALLDRAVGRLQLICANLLYRSYPRLTRPPVNLQPDELLSAVVERLLKSLHEVRPQTVRQFFALVNQHVRWELNDLARRLDQQPTGLVRIQGLTHPEAAEVLGVSPKTVQRRLNRGLVLLAAQLDDLHPS